MKRWLLILTCVCAVAWGEDEAVAPTGAEALKALAAAPGQSLDLQFAPDFAFADNRDAFDEAFAACRKALLADTTDTSVRSNLAALYFSRDKFHPEESGNLEKGISQCLIVLRDEPGNTVVPTFLEDNALLTGLRPAVGDRGMDRLLAALLQSWTDAQNASALRAYARICLFAGRLDDARSSLEKLIETADGPSVQLLLGSLELKSEHAEPALKAFQAVQEQADHTRFAAAAKLGAAQALIKLGRFDEADHLLEMAALNASTPAALDQAAQSAEILPLAAIQWDLGKALARAGEVDRAVSFIGNEVSQILTEKAGHAWSSGDKAGALDTYLQLLELEPGNSDVYVAIGLLSFDLKRYDNAVWALDEAENREATLSGNMLIRLGISHLIMAEYEKAYAAFDRAYRKDPGNSDARGWRIGAAFAVGGWQHALDTLHDAPPLDPAPQNPDYDRLRTYDLAYGIIVDAEKRAKEAGLRYPLLHHLSVHNEILATVAEWSFGGIDRSALKKEKWEVIWEAIELYRALPLKPKPPARAVAQEAIAENLVRQGKVGYEAETAGCNAVEIAPWWPEARYNLGVYARDSYFSINFSSRYVFPATEAWNNERSAAREFLFYLWLAPHGAKTSEVRQQLAKWKVPIPAGL